LPDEFLPPVLTDKEYLFNGTIADYKFRISKKISHADNFLPLIVGKIESSSKGSILFITYRMFPSTLVFMGFFCLMLLLAALFFLLVEKNWTTSVFLFFILTGIYLISVLDFNQKVKISRTLLEKILSE
jgi:GT2 family glycosyltransferase